MRRPPGSIRRARRDSRATWRVCATEEGVTILLTSHILEEADRCDRLVLLHQGHIVAQGSPEELRSRIGGDVVVLDTGDCGEPGGAIEQRFG